MARVRSGLLTLATTWLGVALAAGAPPGAFLAAAQAPPDGIPGDAEQATVVDHVDGDKFRVKLDGEEDEEEVLLIGVDAPEPENDDGHPECFAQEAADRLAELIPEDAAVWLEEDEDSRDGRDRLLRYAWLERDDGEPYLLNTKLVREGFATFNQEGDNRRYDERLRVAEDQAKDKEAGLWGACGGNHVAILPLGHADNPAPPGTTVTVDGQEIIVADPFFSYDYGFATPKGGYVFLVVTVTITNVDDGDHGYEESRFAARDMDSGATFDDTFTLADGALGSGELSPGEFVFGQVVLEVQDTAQRVRIKYDAQRLGEGEVYWLVVR